MTLTDYICKEKVEDDLPALKIALTHQYNDSKTTKKSAEEDWLRPQETILTTRGIEQNENNQKTKVERKTTLDILSG